MNNDFETPQHPEPEAASPAPEPVPRTDPSQPEEHHETEYHEEPVEDHPTEDHPATADAELRAQGEMWGFVDEEGQIHLRQAPEGPSLRVIGKMRGRNPAAALAAYALRFRRLRERVERLESEAATAERKAPLLGRIERLGEILNQAEALGDLDVLKGKIEGLRQEIGAQVAALRAAHAAAKEELCQKAAELAESSEWRKTTEALRGLQELWKQAGSAGREADEDLWHRFRGALDGFFQRRGQYFAERDAKRQEAQTAKEALIQEAQSLAGSTDWKKTTEALRALQERWKQVGSAGREADSTLWQQFREPMDAFFTQRDIFFEQRNQEQRANAEAQEQLCQEAEALVEAEDLKAATDRIKELQGEWKKVGPAPRDQAKGLWDRFRAAGNRVFERAHSEYESRQTEWKTRLGENLTRRREQATRLAESIEHDKGNIARWQENLNNLRPGPREEEIRSSLEAKIEDVSSRIAVKQQRLAELEDSVRDIEQKLD